MPPAIFVVDLLVNGPESMIGAAVAADLAGGRRHPDVLVKLEVLVVPAAFALAWFAAGDA